MKTEYKNKIILLISSFLVLILIITQLRGNNFRQGAENYSRDALENNNFITLADFNSSAQGSIIKLGNPEIPDNIKKAEIISLDPRSLLNPSGIRSIRKSSPPRIIIADSPSNKAITWILLAQKGIKEIYLMAEDKEEMALKYEFRPDADNASR